MSKRRCVVAIKVQAGDKFVGGNRTGQNRGVPAAGPVGAESIEYLIGQVPLLADTEPSLAPMTAGDNGMSVRLYACWRSSEQFCRRDLVEQDSMTVCSGGRLTSAAGDWLSALFGDSKLEIASRYDSGPGPPQISSLQGPTG